MLLSIAKSLPIIVVVVGMALQEAGAADRPNIVIILADDLGYGDVGCYGATKLQTPNIDRLAKEGRRFTDAHTASAVCSPSRYGLMTAQFPLRRNFWGPLPFTNELTIDTAQPTIASVLQSVGYETAIIGKWHLGFGKGKTDWNKPLKPGPLELGFDYYFGMPTVNSGPPFVYVENHSVVDYDPADPFVLKQESVAQKFPEKGGYSQIGGAKKAHERYRDEFVGTTFAEKAVAWIRERDPQDQSKPFFLYLATTNIHHPFTPHPRFKGTSQCGLYGDFVHELDWIVGEVLQTLDETGLADNTLVVFTSDNGGMLNNTGQKAWKAGHRQNGRLLGHKFGAWEGGHRVPFIVRWPGHVPAGTESNVLISQIDLLPTFAAVAEGTIPEDAVIDGVDQLAELRATATKPARDMLIISPNSPAHLTVRHDRWVYIPARDEGGFQGKKVGDHLLGGAAAQKLTEFVNSDVVDGKIRSDAPPAQLYDLEADPYQARNIHDVHAQVVAELAAELKAWRAEIPGDERLGWINLNQSAGRKNNKGGSTKNAAPKTPARPSERSAGFDFESGELAPWKIVEGEFGHLIGSRTEFFNDRGEYNKQGEFYLTTLEPAADASKGLDKQTGVIVSPLFVPEKGTMTFRIGGGKEQSTYAALCTADGRDVEFARGINDQTMQKAEWNLTSYIGQKMFIKVVDHSTAGWGHITVDDFQFDARVLTEYPESESAK
ncbi:MAG: sulfatase-like hydrolase/transferase [Fuerstiella sp.]